jgi:hypothetical protein
MDQNTAAGSKDGHPVFVSLGMLVLDELRFPHLETVTNMPGGSGLYGTNLVLFPVLSLTKLMVSTA